jgi:hypothetical protein
VYHIELRQFPHNFSRFNLTERELRDTVLDAWLAGQWVELGDRKWSPHQAKLTILEGPQLPVEQLSMGRGWSNAKHDGQDVTERLVAGAPTTPNAPAKAYWRRLVGPSTTSPEAWFTPKQAVAPDTAGEVEAPSDLRNAGDSLGLEVLAKLGSEPEPLATAWRLAVKRYPELLASDCLRLAEFAIHSLVDAGLVVVYAENEVGEYEPCGQGEPLEQALRVIDSWSSSGGSSPLRLGRA